MRPKASSRAPLITTFDNRPLQASTMRQTNNAIRKKSKLSVPGKMKNKQKSLAIRNLTDVIDSVQLHKQRSMKITANQENIESLTVAR